MYKIVSNVSQRDIAFGYAYGRMDAEDGSPNTSSQHTAQRFAEYWDELFSSGGSRPNMFDAWKQWTDSPTGRWPGLTGRPNT
jgi:hypothetical protein